MNHKLLKALFAVFLTISIASLVGVGVLLFTDNGKTILPEPALEMESQWYASYPVENVLTFYDDGTYASENWGTKEGSYTIDAEGNRILTDSANDQMVMRLDTEHQMSFTKNELLYTYYDSPELVPVAPAETDAPELVSIRIHAVKAILDQGVWTGGDHTLEASTSKITLDGAQKDYSVNQVRTEGETYVCDLTVGSNPKTLIISADMETMLYTIDFDGLTFSADGSNFRLDS